MHAYFSRLDESWQDRIGFTEIKLTKETASFGEIVFIKVENEILVFRKTIPHKPISCKNCLCRFPEYEFL